MGSRGIADSQGGDRVERAAAATDDAAATHPLAAASLRAEGIQVRTHPFPLPHPLPHPAHPSPPTLHGTHSPTVPIFTDSPVAIAPRYGDRGNRDSFIMCRTQLCLNVGDAIRRGERDGPDLTRDYW